MFLPISSRPRNPLSTLSHRRSFIAAHNQLHVRALANATPANIHRVSCAFLANSLYAMSCSPCCASCSRVTVSLFGPP